jgi:uncharacterized protein YacL (UPF0231 family)
LVFIDADAIVLNRIEEVFNYNFDIAVTLRSEDERNVTRYPPINAGVIFLNVEKSWFNDFIEQWVSKMKDVETLIEEQRALSRLVSAGNDTFYDDYYNQNEVEIRDDTISIMTLPCKKYNYYSLDDGFSKKENNIIHLKGWKHTEKKYDDLLKQI